MNNAVRLDFAQPPVGVDIDVYLNWVTDCFEGQSLYLEHCGSYIIQAVNSTDGRVLVRRYGSGDDVPTGILIRAGTKVCGSYKPDPLLTLTQTLPSYITRGGIDKKKFEEELGIVKAALLEVRESIEAEAGYMSRKSDSKIPPWMVRAHAAQEVKELYENLNQLSGLALADAVNRSVALYYEEDPTVAGMTTAAISCLPGEPTSYYASIVRYTNSGGLGKQVVAHCMAPGLEAAIRGAARSWLDLLQAERQKRLAGSLAEQEANDRQEELDMENQLTESLQKVKLILGDSVPAFLTPENIRIVTSMDAGTPPFRIPVKAD